LDKLQCELCNGTEFTKTDEYFVCDFCRTKYSTEQAKKMMIEGTVEVAGTVQVDRGNETANLITLAKSALAGGNPSEAFDYANRALEIDVDNSEAWAFKAKAAGWASTLKNLRFTEMLSSFNTALEKAPEENRNELKIEWAGDMLGIGVAVHNLSWKHVNQFPGVQGTWQEHINRCSQIFSVIDIAYQWGGQRAILESNITIASNLIVGIKFKDARGKPRVVFLQPAFQQMMQARIDRAGDEMRKFDPSYATPKPKKSKVGLF
jgi:hypothetical protein